MTDGCTTTLLTKVETVLIHKQRNFMRAGLVKFAPKIKKIFVASYKKCFEQVSPLFFSVHF